jgi:hypothetical protein
MTSKTQIYDLSHSRLGTGLVTMPLKHKYMTSKTQIYDLSLSWCGTGLVTIPLKHKIVTKPVPHQESERSYICVLEVIYLCFRGHIFVLWYRFCFFPQFFYWILELFQWCGIFVVHYVFIRIISLTTGKIVHVLRSKELNDLILSLVFL